jgi:crotonobetainyl-CoA:carnitine CoA-transferase CaiB-like acyl-CoA transferase
MPGPLEGYRVLDFGRFELAPLTGAWLADMGADVIKVESRAGDPVRGSHPAAVAIVTAHNRGKRSIAIDVTRPEGREAILRLVRQADVVVHNFRLGVMEKLGLGYDDLVKVNEGIVYASGTAFGPEGPRRYEPGFDTLGQAAGGLAFATGAPEGDPIIAGAAIMDAATGMALVTAILAALLERQRSGKGQMVDTSLYGTTIALQSWEIGFCSITGRLPTRNGAYPYLSGYGIYPTSDGFMAIGGLNDKQWPAFCRIIQREDLASAWPAALDRMAHQRELQQLVAEYTRKRSTADWLETLSAVDIYACMVQSYQDILNDPHAVENWYVMTLNHEVTGEYRGAGTPWRFSRTASTPGNVAPDLGMHTEEVLLEGGYEWEEIAKLRDQGIVGFEQ